MEFIDVSAKTIEDAIAKGVAQLAEDGQELVETKVLEQPSNGFLGIGRKPAVVRLFFTSVAKTATQEEVAHVEEQSVAVASKPVATSETEVQDTAVEASEGDVVEKPSKKELSKEDQQEIAEKGKQFLDDMFTQMGLTVVIEKMMTKDKITFQVHGEDLGILIGKHGQTLDAIQYLTNLVA
ncbi:MAG: KH domain-containing protein, partial [Veillonella sp.]|nr:KH domain-containing protein [Veillonella sp.]